MPGEMSHRRPPNCFQEAGFKDTCEGKGIKEENESIKEKE